MENSMLAHNIYESCNITHDQNTGDWNIIDTIGNDNWIGDNPLTLDNYFLNYWYPYVYPTTTYIPEKSKIEQAFKILNKLMEKGVVSVNKVKTFVDLVAEIADCI